MSLHALLTTAAFARVESQGWLRVTGEDRVRWLNGMTTNSIQDLKPGQGCYTFFLNAQGRIQADAIAWLFDDFLLLETARDQVAALLALLNHFIIMDDVELTEASNEGKALMLIAGPQAASVLAGIGISPPTEPLRIKFQSWRSAEIEVSKAPAIIPHFRVFADESTLASLISALREAGLPQATPADLEQLRILSGIPLYGTDIRNTEIHKDLPQETAQTQALHFSKGCYLGQEIVERIRSRGAVHRTFTGFTLIGDLPAAGISLFEAGAPGKSVGELTSVTRIELPEGLAQLALGYVRREAFDRGSRIQYAGGTALPATLPFYLTNLVSKRA